MAKKATSVRRQLEMPLNGIFSWVFWMMFLFKIWKWRTTVCRTHLKSVSPVINIGGKERLLVERWIHKTCHTTILTLMYSVEKQKINQPKPSCFFTLIRVPKKSFSCDASKALTISSFLKNAKIKKWVLCEIGSKGKGNTLSLKTLY